MTKILKWVPYERRKRGRPERSRSDEMQNQDARGRHVLREQSNGVNGISNTDDNYSETNSGNESDHVSIQSPLAER